jgi:phosphate acetyltransferase
VHRNNARVARHPACRAGLAQKASLLGLAVQLALVDLDRYQPVQGLLARFPNDCEAAPCDGTPIRHPWNFRWNGGSHANQDSSDSRCPGAYTTRLADNVRSVSRSVYVASPEGLTGKSAVALGLLDALTREVGSVGVFRPLTTTSSNSADVDLTVDLLVNQPGISQSYEEAIGVTYDAARQDADEALHMIVERFGQLTDRFDVILVVGSDYSDVTTGTELSFNAKIAANLGSPVVLVVHGRERTPEQIRTAAASAIAELRAHHAQTVAVIANRVDHVAVEAIRNELAKLGDVVTAAIPESPLLSAPTFRALVEAADGELALGSEAWMDREALSVIVAAMSLPHVLDRLLPDVTVIAPSDRTDLLPGLMLAHQSGTFPTLSGILLTGGYEIPESIRRLSEGVQQDLPIAMTDLGTFTTAERLMRVRGPITTASSRKIETARRVFAEQVDQAALLAAINVSASDVRTPLMFEYQLVERARADRQRIVLPESEDDRILEAAAILLRRGVANLILLGDETKVRARASALGLDLDEASIVSPLDPELVEIFAAAYAEARAHKGMTLERARDIVTDISYFGTMMVHLGMADGMVSGAVNTTAHTIRPGLEFIKTKPGVNTVSSVFLMCLADRVLAYGDCAVIPEPTVEQLADIAISSAGTAQQFGIEPRVAMLSYSTGTSGSGAEVEKVRAATELVRQRAPDLMLEGPIQYDAAVDPEVARTKLPNSPVAGRATVFIFPDLNTGNNTYKAVQRSAHAIAIGPVLQGLRKPVNDLSRGALVEDIVNTVAITAVQAQAIKQEQPSEEVAAGSPS